MKPPDMVVDARDLIRQQQQVTNHYDVLKRDRLPMAMHSMELEWREHPVPIAMRVLVTNGKLAFLLLSTFVLSTLLIAPAARIYGRGLFSPVTYPLLVLVCGLAAYCRFALTASLAESAWRFFVPQAVFIFLECSLSPSVNPRFVLIPLAFSIFGLGYLADRVNTHYVRWITANLHLKREAVVKRRRVWDQRFNWFALTKQISGLKKEIRALEAEQRAEEAFVLRRRAGELMELRSYPLGFLVLVYIGSLLLLGASTTMLTVSAFAVSIAMAFRRPVLTLKLARLISEVVVHSFVSWFSWDPKQVWTDSPGMFKDGLQSRFRRLTQTVFYLLLVQITFIPSIHLWGSGDFLGPIWLWSSVYDFFSNLLLPAFMLMCALIATGARPLWMQLEAIEWCEASEDLDKSETIWDALTGRLQLSPINLERRHILLGWHAEYGYPVLIDRKLLCEHVHILGDSGSGKTSRMLAPTITQLIRGDDGPVVIIDLKGDMALFEAARREAQKCGRTFKHFTNVLGRSSYLFNPFQQVNSETTSLVQFVETLMESLRLNHGDGYGTRFFSVQSREWLLKTVKRFPNITSFEELEEKATPEFFRNEAEIDRCREAISVVRQIAQVAALNWKPKPGESDRPLKEAIFMPDVVREKQVIYAWLPAGNETSTVKEVANLMLYALFTAVRTLHEQGHRQRSYLVIDEFQQVASAGFKLILAQSRAFGLSLVLANQSESDLMSRDANRLLDTVRANTQLKVYLSVKDPNTIKLLEKASGLIPYYEAGRAPMYRPRLTINDIQAYSGHEDCCICWITRDSGFGAYGGDWFGVRTDFHITFDEFRERSEAAWPAATEATIVAHRDVEGSTTFFQGMDAPARLPLFGTELELEPALVVPHDSKWAKRLAEIYDRRFAGRENGYGV